MRPRCKGCAKSESGMPPNPRVFLDTSALFAGIQSARGGDRLILKLGEAGAVDLLVSPQVLDEAEGALRRKARQTLGVLALLLDRSGAKVIASSTAEALEESRSLTGHLADAHVMAAAWAARIDCSVSLDRAHFLDNHKLKGAVLFPVGTPGDFLAWYRGGSD